MSGHAETHGLHSQMELHTFVDIGLCKLTLSNWAEAWTRQSPEVPSDINYGMILHKGQTGDEG